MRSKGYGSCHVCQSVSVSPVPYEVTDFPITGELEVRKWKILIQNLLNIACMTS